MKTVFILAALIPGLSFAQTRLPQLLDIHARVVEWGALEPTTAGMKAGQKMPAELKMTGLLAGKDVVAVSGGLNHSLAVFADGKLVAWGNNARGQLGNGTTRKSSVPVSFVASGVLAGKKVIAAAAGGEGASKRNLNDYSLVLCSDGTLSAWGDNSSGQLGNGSKNGSLLPVAVDQTGILAGKTVVSIAAGGHRNLALCSDGTVAAWGFARDFSSLVPVAIKQSDALAGKKVTSIAAGYDHCLVLCEDGTVTAWGGMVWQPTGPGVLGNNSGAGSYVPVAVNTQGVLAGKRVTAIAAGRMHSLALCSDGTLAAWGSNFHGELGNNRGLPYSKFSAAAPGKAIKGKPVYSFVPVQVDQTGVLAGKTVIAVSAGAHHSLALCSDGSMAVWGDCSPGSLGDDGNSTISLVPIAVSKTSLVPGMRFVGLSTGSGQSYFHNVALVAPVP